jgi:uncharacterized protein (TIGR02246 family)
MTGMVSADLTDAIKTTNDAFLAAVERGDAAGMADVYTDDGAVLPTNAGIIRGKPAIQAFWQAALEGLGMRGATLATVELELQGDTAVEVGEYTIKGEGGSTVDEGKYVVIWRRQGDQWKWHRDIFNTSRPA